MKLIFICTGNTCRSPMAEGILKDFAKEKGLDLQVISAGTHAAINVPAANFAIQAMEDIGININSHRSNQVNKELLEKSDLVLTMSKSHKKYLIHTYPFIKDKVFLLNEYAYGKNSDIEDPFGAPLSYYVKARDEIYRAVEEIVGLLTDNK